MKKTILIIGLLMFSGIAFAQEDQQRPDFFATLGTIIAETIQGVIETFIPEPPEPEIVSQIKSNIYSGTINPRGTANTQLIAIEDAFNSFELTREDYDFLDERFGETFVIQANVVMGDGSITITHIIKDGDRVFVTSEGTDLPVDQELTIQIAVIENIIDSGGLTVQEGISLILDGKLEVDAFFGLKLIDLQNLPSLGGR